MKLLRMVLTGGLLLVLAACGNDSPINPPTTPPTTPPTNPPPNPPTDPVTPPIPGLPTDPGTPTDTGISGAVSAPEGGDVTNALVLACAESDPECASALNTTVDTAGAYSFTGLQAEPYAVIAFKDVDTSNSLTNGDYFGFYSTDGTSPAPVTPPASGINIAMQVYSDSSTPTDPVEPPPTEGGSISGAVFYPPPSGGEPTSTGVVFACNYTGDDAMPCDETLSGGVEVQLATSSNAYSIDNLQAGQFLVFAFEDTDGNGSFEDAGDRIGLYPSLEAPALVSPPAIGIDISLDNNLSDLGEAGLQRAGKAAIALFGKRQLEPRLERAIRTLR